MGQTSRSWGPSGAARTGLAAGLLTLVLQAPAWADDTVDLGNQVPDAKTIQQGLFPEDECEQLKAAGFKCMGFKPAVRFSVPAVAFKLGSAELPDGVKQQLDAFANVLRTRGGSGKAQVRIEGHADATGDPATNQDLSQRRAEAARQYLIAKGVDASLLNAVGVGSRDLKNPTKPEAAENRRVTVGREPVQQ